jgi:hypothetical protein
MSENRVLRRIFGPKRKIEADGENGIMRNLISGTFPQYSKM